MPGAFNSFAAVTIGMVASCVSLRHPLADQQNHIAPPKTLGRRQPAFSFCGDSFRPKKRREAGMARIPGASRSPTNFAKAAAMTIRLLGAGI